MISDEKLLPRVVDTFEASDKEAIKALRQVRKDNKEGAGKGENPLKVYRLFKEIRVPAQ